jgi:hypothetical protein
MIYTFPAIDDPIQQGDIFRWIPSIDFSLKEFAFIKENSIIKPEGGWHNLIQPIIPEKPFEIIVNIRPVFGIVASQDCDIIRSLDITFCEIGPFKDIDKQGQNAVSAKTWMSLITKHARINQKWFYLPPDEKLGFKEKMAVDFRSITKVNRVELEEYKAILRVGRLNELSTAHFRERIAEFFRRYPYNEWYPLNSEELEAYQKEKGEVDHIYEWQKPSTK